MKPHLKLSTHGRITVLRPAIKGWLESEAKRRLQDQYGSMAAFAERFGFKYSDVLTALCVDGDHYATAAGGIASVRQALGLKSTPSKTALAQVRAQRLRRESQKAKAQA